MRITFVLPTLSVGGAEIQSINQLNEISKRGISCQLIVLSEIDFLKDSIDPSIKVRYLNNPKLKFIDRYTGLSIIKSFNSLRKCILEFNPSHIVTHLPISHLIVRIIKKFNNNSAKLACYHHSTYFSIYPKNSVRKKLSIIINNWLAQNDSLNIFISEAVQKDITSKLKLPSHFLLNNAIPNVELQINDSNSILHQFNLQEQSYFLIPGRIQAIKGQDFFLQVTHELIKKGEKKIVIAGYGSYMKELKKIVEQYKIQDKVIFTGLVSNKEILALIKHSILVIVPSKFEGFGNVVIESFMMGKTVIASNAGGLPEVVKHNETGYIFKKDDENELYDIFSLANTQPEKLIINSEKLKDEYLKKYQLIKQVDRLLVKLNSLNQ